MDHAGHALWAATNIYIRETNATSNGTTTTTTTADATRPASYKIIGTCLAVASGVFIGISFVFKKLGLLKANDKYNEVAGEGYGYLKNAYWWGGMSLMIVGEICNFVAYSFTDSIIVTSLGALSVVITAILSAIFLKERLSMVGMVGCFLCIVGSVVIVLNAPAESAVANIQEMQSYVIAPGFLSYTGVIILACLFLAFWVAPRYGKKTMLVYLTICSLIGGLSVVATQGLGAAIIAQINGTPQFNQWFIYVLMVFVITTLLTEIIYLNKALNLFNAALVTPTYYVIFTSATIVTSAILFRGFKGTVMTITTVVMGFFTICAGVVLLQLSKSAKDVPDTAVFAGDLDQVRTIAEQQASETEPKADAIRGAGLGTIVRRFSVARNQMELDEAKRLHEEKMADLESIGEAGQFEWDGIRRRRTVRELRGQNSQSSFRPLSSLRPVSSLHPPELPVPNFGTPRHPPLGMSHFPSYEDIPEDEEARPNTGGIGSSFFGSLRDRARSRGASDARDFGNGSKLSNMQQPVAMSAISVANTDGGFDPQTHVYGLPSALAHQDTSYGGAANSDRPHTSHTYNKSLHVTYEEAPAHRPLSAGSSTQRAPSPPEHKHSRHDSSGGARRQFSFHNVFHKAPRPSIHDAPLPGLSKRNRANDTEEERLGLVKGDTNTNSHSGMTPVSGTDSDSDNDDIRGIGGGGGVKGLSSLGGYDGDIGLGGYKDEQGEGEEGDEYAQRRRRWVKSHGGESPRMSPRRT